LNDSSENPPAVQKILAAMSIQRVLERRSIRRTETMKHKAWRRIRQLLLLSLCFAAANGAVHDVGRTFLMEQFEQAECARQRQQATEPTPVKDLLLIGWNALREGSSSN
jgi:hypothetical protein